MKIFFKESDESFFNTYYIFRSDNALSIEKIFKVCSLVSELCQYILNCSMLKKVLKVIFDF